MAVMRIDILSKKGEENKVKFFTTGLQRAAQLANIQIDINTTQNFSAFGGHSFNPSKTPIVFINGHVEFMGEMPGVPVLQVKLCQLRDKGSESF